MIKCCKGCTKRQVGCHSKCEDYISQKKKILLLNEERCAKNRLEDDIRSIRNRRFRQ